MTILYLAHRIPYPPNKGDKIRSYHHVRYLAQRHDVHVIAFVDAAEDLAGAAALREFCRTAVLVRRRRPQSLLRGMRALVRGRSVSEGYFTSPQMWRAVRRASAATTFDVAWAFSSAMAQYLPAVNAPRRIADFVDMDSEKWRQFAAQSAPPRRWLYALEAARLRRFEAAAGRYADQVLFVSRPEAQLFESVCGATVRVAVVPNGVDTAYFAAADAPVEGPPDLLFTGALDYRPNIDAVLFFVRTVLPLVRRAVPGARLIAVGHRPAAELRREAERRAGALVVAGSVPDVRPYFRQARVYVAPLRLGRGVQNKVLEAMAMRVPVVASPLAVAGIEVEAGRHVLVADDPADYAAQVVGLLQAPARRQALASAAAELIEQRYRWSANLQLLEPYVGGAGAGADPAVARAGLQSAPCHATGVLPGWIK